VEKWEFPLIPLPIIEAIFHGEDVTKLYDREDVSINSTSNNRSDVS